MNTAIPTIGTFGWSELATSDLAAAKTFYAGLFGWDLHDDSMGEGMGTYKLIGGKTDHFGGMYEMSGPQFEGVPPNWTSYVGVENCDAAAQRVTELGGKVLMPPMDIPDTGRFAIVTDPGGAAFAVFQSASDGDKDMPCGDTPGSFCWRELNTKDSAQAETFYSALFGWTALAKELAHGAYSSFMQGDQPVAGMQQMTAEWGDAPPHWMTYMAVEDCDASAAKVEALGGSVCVPPTDIPEVGRFAVINDPAGATFSIIKLVPQS
jgi:predicted enzyme related to lactoylglutathione lyase